MPRTMLVTGASKGIGLEIAKTFLLAPDNDVETLILVARESKTFRDNLERLRLENPHSKTVAAFALDLADRAAILDVVPRIYAEHGNIHLLVNNAGYTKPTPLQQVEFADFERTMAVNLYAPFTVVQELLHHGNTFDLVVNIASTAGLSGRPGWLTYSASKAALINMSEVMREELAIYGTRVACISPGRTATDLRKVLAPEEDPTTIMQPEDVASVVEMLASPVGRFVDSANLVVRH